MSRISSILQRGFDRLYAEEPRRIESFVTLLTEDDEEILTEEGETLDLWGNVLFGVPASATTRFEIGAENVIDEDERAYTVKNLKEMAEGEHVLAEGTIEGRVTQIIPGPLGAVHRIVVKRWRQ